jgi:hypothetical protein
MLDLNQQQWNKEKDDAKCAVQEQRQQIRRRVLDMLRTGKVPHEFREYAKLVKKIGLEAAEIGEVPGTSERVSRFRSYLQAAARAGD